MAKVIAAARGQELLYQVLLENPEENQLAHKLGCAVMNDIANGMCYVLAATSVEGTRIQQLIMNPRSSIDSTKTSRLAFA